MFNIIDLALESLESLNFFAEERSNVGVQENLDITSDTSEGHLSLIEYILQEVPLLTSSIKYPSVTPLKQLFPLALSLNPKKFLGVEAGDTSDDGERQTLITNTPAFHQVNSAGMQMLRDAFGILGRVGFIFSQKDSVFHTSDSFEGNIEINTLGNMYHHAQTEISNRTRTFGAYSNSRSLGMHLTLKDLLRHTTLMGNCGINHAEQSVVAQLGSDFELEDLHMTAELDYSQLATEGNKIHYDTVLRHQDYLLGYAWVCTLLQSPECCDMSHEHKFSFGWTDIDYAVNFTTSRNLSHHSFQLYQVINAEFDQTVAMNLNQETNLINTEVALRWKMTPQDILTFKIDSNSRVGVAVEKKFNEIVKIKGAASVLIDRTQERALSFGFGVELEL